MVNNGKTRIGHTKEKFFINFIVKISRRRQTTTSLSLSIRLNSITILQIHYIQWDISIKLIVRCVDLSFFFWECARAKIQFFSIYFLEWRMNPNLNRKLSTWEEIFALCNITLCNSIELEIFHHSCVFVLLQSDVSIEFGASDERRDEMGLQKNSLFQYVKWKWVKLFLKRLNFKVLKQFEKKL